MHEPGSSERDRRDEVIARHLGLAHHIARRYSSGRRDDDVVQVARLALIDAVDRFDRSLGVPFAAFAGRTIEGAIKRHFENTHWPVGVPRRVRRLSVAVTGARAALEQELGRSPTVAELAARLDTDTDAVVEALAADDARSVASLDAAPSDGPRDVPQTDPGFAAVDRGQAVDALLGDLDDAAREVVELCLFAELSQREVAARLGVSQMQVSRTLRRGIAALRRRATS